MGNGKKLLTFVRKMCCNGNAAFALGRQLGWEFRRMPDRAYLEKMYRFRLGVEPDLDHPKTYNEKLQYLKLHEHYPERAQLVDKIEVKRYVAQVLGPEYLIPTLGVWSRFADIDFDSLPRQFVLKCSHDSGGQVICPDKETLNRKRCQRKIEKSLHRNFYYRQREWLYQAVPPRILAEPFISDGVHKSLVDYKLFCFDGVPKFIMTVNGGHGDESLVERRIYDTQWKLLSIGLRGKPPVETAEEKPAQLPVLLEAAEKLSRGMKHVRVDLYLVNGKVYFGELTFYHMSGFEEFVPRQWDEKLGELIQLEKEAEIAKEKKGKTDDGNSEISGTGSTGDDSDLE